MAVAEITRQMITAAARRLDRGAAWQPEAVRFCFTGS
jgi:hypothetical protein